MLDTIYTYRWELFILTEVVFWLCIALFIVARYFLGWYRVSVWILPIFIISVLADAALGWIDYQATGEFSTFQFIVIIFIIYAATSGLSDFKRLDAFIQRKVAKWKGEPEPQVTLKQPPKYGVEHARHERKGWYMHVMIFALAATIFVFLFGTSDQFEVSMLFDKDFYVAWWNDTDQGMYRDSALNQIMKTWFIILIVDAVISLSYTVSPRQKKETGQE